MLLPALLLGLAWALAHGRWCERTETVLLEEEVTPRQEDVVPCASLYHYRRQGWRPAPGSARAGLCPVYKPPETRPAARNQTVRACCPGWGGTRCTVALADTSPEGHCFATWQCQPRAGSTNASAGSLQECCAWPWAHSWWDGRSRVCLGCTSQQLPGDTPSPAPLQPLAGAVTHLWSQHQRPAATCATWSGFHYRTFDGRHFHFLGRCSYLLAGAADSSWAVHLTPRGHCPQPGHCQLARVTMGPEEVLVQGGAVSVNGQLVPEGESRLLHGLSLQWQGDWLVLSGGLGVVVRLDRSTSVSVSVDRELQGQTQGLCGLYNGRPEDDFLKPGGGLAALAATFGNSWRLPDSEPGCPEAVEVAQGCEDPLMLTEAGLEASWLRAEAQDVCHQLLDGPLRECHAQVPPAEYHEACLFAYCAGVSAGSGPEGRREAACATLAHYARACAQRDIAVHWRKPGFCERPCPGGQQYSDCASACPPSCSAAGEGAAGPCGAGCVGGCECPRGLLWDGALCVPAARCPCYHRRQRYAPGDTVRQRCNPCVCREGRWRCAQAPCPAECAVGGDGHYVTFDGRSFSFRGRAGCSHRLVQDLSQGQLLIVLDHGACDSGSCLRAMSVSLGDTHIQLRDSGAVLVHGQDVGLPWRGAGGLRVVRASSSFLLLHWPGAQLLWGVSDSAAYITLDPRYAHQVLGLCGTFTWNQQDDFLTPAGDVETSIAAFASKFQVAGDGKCSSEDSTLLSPCGTHTQGYVFAEATCAILQDSAFQECHGLVDREPFHLRCLAAACDCGPGGACLCPVLAAYARRCAQEGALTSWRNQTLCPVACPAGQEYQECAPACGQHCGEPEDCGELAGCVAGCTCPPGLLWDPEGQCVPPSLCSCQLGAHRYAAGSATRRDCNHCVCQERGLWNCTAHRCTPQRALCPGELVHVPGACLLTCDSPSANLSCPPGNSAGCVCPPGTVLLDERCVPPELCPCRHGGQWYPPNATIREDCNVCVCQGRHWRCAGQQCAGRCQASGAPHYVTFDGLALTFPGACEYLLVREASGRFTVSAQNLPCGAAGLTCTKALTVRLQGTAVRMLRGRAVTVNGVSVTLPKDYTGSGLSLRRAGLFLLLTSRLGLSLLWDGGTRVLVQLSPQFRGRVAGLCGDFDGDAGNDLRSRQGVLEPTAELAAHSWRLSPLCPEPGDLPHPCTVNAHRAGWARTRCGAMLQPLFARCHAEVPPQQHYEWCVYDACGCDSGGDCECLCSAIATYADECARHGVHVRWRSQELCPLQCEGGQVYEACGPPCPPTCHDHRPEPGWHCQAVACVEGCFCPEGTLLHGGICLEPASCPCQWKGSFFPAGTVLQEDCGNCTCQESQWLCGGDGARCQEPAPDCAEGEVPCQESGHCVPRGWLCDNQDDCGDGSDEEGCAAPHCGDGQMTCSSGHCLPLALLCDGRDDCGDGTDEQDCPCPPDSLACADGRCLPPTLLCNGHPDCPDAADEESCLGQVDCTPGEVPCVEGTCVGAAHLCDGVWDCPDGADEGPGHCPLPSLPTPPAGTWPGPTPGPGETVPTLLASASPGPSCSPSEFECSSGECTPRGWRCDHEEDCADGSDEQDCSWPCGPHQMPCARGPNCMAPTQLCDGAEHCPDGWDEGPDVCGSTQLPPCSRGLFSCGSAPRLCLSPERLCDGTPDCVQGEDERHCEGLRDPGVPNRTGGSCQEYSCPGGRCISFQLVCNGQPDCEWAGEAVLSPEEQGCGVWGPWSPWGPCSQTCGPGVQGRSRRCSPTSLPVLQRCPGPEHQAQACFAAACPVDGQWSPWTPWSPCSESCGGTSTRERRCHPPQNRGRACATLPGGPPSSHQTRPCPQDGCPNATCPGELVFRPCAPCPLTCEDISGQALCAADRPCSSPGCWCPEGQVLGSEGRCMQPRQCPCLVGSARYWPGQRVRTDDCQLCICQDGRPRRCQPNPDCAVNCGWSSWSPWAECLGPCGSQSIQWSFRSPNNPRLSGQGRRCRGLHRKARRCQTKPCGHCEQHGLVHGVGARWRGGPCSVCQCLHDGTVLCSPYCPLGSCPQDWVLVEGPTEPCCRCVQPGEEQAFPAVVTPGPTLAPSARIGAPLVTYILPPPGDPCYAPLGLAWLSEGGLWLEGPASTAPPGAATRGSDPQAQQHAQTPPQQLDLLRPQNLTGLLVQGAGAVPRLQLSSDGLHWHSYTDLLPAPLPPPKVESRGALLPSGVYIFPGNQPVSAGGISHGTVTLKHSSSPWDWGDATPAAWMFGHMVQARYVRVWPQDAHQSRALRVELLGCGPVVLPCSGAGPRCASGECAPKGAPCDGVGDCEDRSDEDGCAPPAAGARRVPSAAETPGLSPSGLGQLLPQPRQGLAEAEHRHLGQGPLTASTGKGPVSAVPGSEAPHASPEGSVPTMTTASISQPKAKVLGPGMAAVTVPHSHPMSPAAPAGQHAAPGPFPPVQCSPGQVPCQVLACVGWEQLCDGTEDCLDGSDERHVVRGARRPREGTESTEPFTVPTTALPGLPAPWAPCSPSQLSCGSGECLASERRCDLRPDCQDGSDEDHCVDCVLGPWSGWSGCSHSCGPGFAFQQRELLRPPLPGGSCPPDRLHSQPCFVQACPVAGAWAVWEAWGPCSVSCGGGHRSRRRSCADPPPKNGGAPCPGASQEGAPCSLQPCTGGTDCGPGRVHVSADLCRQGLVPPCPPSCLDPTANRSCGGHCLEGCRCPPGLLLHGAGCLPLSECPCLVGGELRPPGVPFLLDNCSWCLCEEGALLCEPWHCPVPCGWSAWSSWGPCDRSCGSGLRARFRSPSNPPAAFGGAPCEGDRQELQACHLGCGTEAPGWTPWTSWSACSQSCLAPGGGPGWRSRSRLCPGPVDTSCPGEATQEEPCSPALCLVPSVWGPWAAWSACSAPCDGGVQTRGRRCSGSAPGDPECQGPHSQTRDCNTQACTAQCPGDMVFRSAEQCRQEGGPCPQLCLAQGRGVECTGSCAPGCACPPGLFLHNASCLPRHQCPCQLHGQLQAPGAVALLDSCNNCTCISGEMVCTSEPCPVACGWSPWTPWSPCSRSCNVGVRRRFRAGTAPPAVFGGAACQGPNMEAEFCSLRPCQGPSEQWGHWSACSVPCGGGYRNRSRGSGLPGQMDFSACGLQPCAGPVPGVCPGDKQWLDCAQGPASCVELSAPPGANRTCRPGCYCPPGTLLLNNVCVPTQDCPCTHGGRLYPPGGTVLRPCENCSCVSGLITNCTSWPCEEGQPTWSRWTPWSMCSASCGPARRHRHRFCARRPGAVPTSVTLLPPLAPITTPCPGPEAEEEPCLLPGCDRAGAWGPWGPWSSCSRSCGGGLRSRIRACDEPPPQGLGDYCEGPRAQGEACQVLPCPVTNCSTIEGAVFSPCGPPCPRSCDDLVHCVWRCQPGCYCPPGHVLSADGVVCVRPAHCGCLDLLTGARHHSGTRLARPDGCNHCTCLEGKLNCTDLPCPVPGGWCPWSEWTACSQPCRGQMRTRSRACACPAPQQGGAPCPGGAGEGGPQQQREVCPSAECPGEVASPPVPVPTTGASLASQIWPHLPGAVDGAWSAWGPCSRSCGGLGTRTRSRQCVHPTPAPGGQGCPGPRQDLEFCLSPDCPGAAGSTVEPVTGHPGGWGLWSPWSPCSHSCTDPAHPALRGRTRLCLGNCTRGDTSQERPCNLPSCTELPQCPGPGCVAGNCSWTAWAPWGPCSRSCGVGQQRRLRAYHPPGPGGHWCPDILTAFQEWRFCGLRACPVPGGWSRWSPWSWCDRSCGGGRSLRSRHCSSPPPKNGGAPCVGEKHHVRLCNPMPCEAGCPVGMELVSCANRCPRRCSDLQEGIVCQEGQACQQGCRCSEGSLEQDGGCVPVGHCECTDAQGRSWAPGSQPQEACSNCTCQAGRLTCAARPCLPPALCTWSRWSAWSPCSRSCGPGGQQSRFRSSTSGSWAPECREEQSQRQPCPQPPCPPLCLHGGLPWALGDSWLQGACRQCSCTPEGVLCEDTDCAAPGAWSPWSPWSDCPVSCGGGSQVRTRICSAATPRLGGTPCVGPDRQTQPCGQQPCLGLLEACSWGPWSPCSRSCGPGLASRAGSCPCPLADPGCTSPFLHLDTRACYLGSCLEECAWSSWSSWTPCSCRVRVQQRYRHQGPAAGGAREGPPCTRLDGHFRPCVAGNCSEDSCTPPFEFQACGSPCTGLCATHLSRQLCQDLPPCQPGCYCPEGLLEQAGGCVPPEQCPCQHISRDRAVTLMPGERLWLGCKECECRRGELQCTSRGCEGLLPLSGWSEWSPCGPCLPPNILAPASRTALEGRWTQDPAGAAPTAAPLLASEQHRHRLCLDPETGRPWAGDPDLCSEPLSQQRLCPDPGACRDLCQWSPWGPWSPCHVPCGGGFRLRWREAGAPHGGGCQGPWAQTESCNLGPCPGESCEARETVPTLDCANRCPRSCMDLWDRVQCLQGPCRPGCRCPPGQLVQDGRCVPISSCRCGLPSPNASWVLAPAEVVQLDCKSCTCANGSLECLLGDCPVLGPWSAWSNCSAPCGGGTRKRYRSCQRGPGGTLCQAQDMEQQRECNQQPCPECPPGQVLSACATSCPYLCSHLLPGALCEQVPCQRGCSCPGGQLLHNGTCVPSTACPCAQHSLPWGLTLTLEEQALELPPGAVLTQNCTRCTCQGGVFNCSLDKDCQECPPGEIWQQETSRELGPCEQTCREPSATETRSNCSAPGCVCRPGLLRSQAGPCVPAEHCECWHLGRPHPPASEWQEACESCRCLHGTSVCAQLCPLLTCAQGEVTVQEPGSCCPTCRRETLEEQPDSCHPFTELRNLTKGLCYLDQVEVTYCRGHCPSSTHVMPEEPYLQSQCQCCSYRLDPDSPVRILSLHCPDGRTEPVVLPAIHSCQCSACQGGDFSKR